MFADKQHCSETYNLAKLKKRIDKIKKHKPFLFLAFLN